MASDKQANLFQVYLRLRPPPARSGGSTRFLSVEEPEQEDLLPTHITIDPPGDRRRAIEKFAFTQVFEEASTQLDVFQDTQILPLIEGVLAPQGGEGTDALVATLGSHTILGSKSQRGLTQLSLDAVFRAIGPRIADIYESPSLEAEVQTADASEAAVTTATTFIDNVYGDLGSSRGSSSRSGTPMFVGTHPALTTDNHNQAHSPWVLPSGGPQESCNRQNDQSSAATIDKPLRFFSQNLNHSNSRDRSAFAQWHRTSMLTPTQPTMSFMRTTSSASSRRYTKPNLQGETSTTNPNRRFLARPSNLPTKPDISPWVTIASDENAEYCVVLSMYEVYNDRIFDLLTPPIKPPGGKEPRRRPLLFKSTEASPDRKVVAGLRKVICSNYHEAILVLEAGLQERRVTGTGSNSVSSRSHGFFAVEIKKRKMGRRSATWAGSTLTIVDLAGSERARDAKTQGATLAEAGKINESLMYLGQCLQMQTSNKPNIVPFRQCKLTELLFSNSFPSSHMASSSRPPQKGVMIVTADPYGDFNATSQILRYGALAREVSVPRIPSIFSNADSTSSASVRSISPSEILMSPPPVANSRRPMLHPPQKPFRTPSPAHIAQTQHMDERGTMELAALEIARLSEEIEALRADVAAEAQARLEAEAHLLTMEDKMLEQEQVIREECATEFDTRLELELARWKTNLALEQERGEAHLDRKIELLEKGLALDELEEQEDKENVLIENLEEENERLRREVAVMKRELAQRSPTKRVPLGEREDFAPVMGVREVGSLSKRLEKLRFGGELAIESGRSSVSSSRSASPSIVGASGTTGQQKRASMRKIVAKRREEDY
ncbi:Kinesin-like motor protein 9 [Ceratocystis lukuohia]|uniref:Kinesin-like protein n=1 Tax=Ceratocystis lukuohia TaxID=2019550 RepID=A0ABR4MHC9_9PEZI